jgi:diacylglycerol kinase (ATP)
MRGYRLGCPNLESSSSPNPYPRIEPYTHAQLGLERDCSDMFPLTLRRREAHLILNPAADRGRSVRWRDFVSRFLEERGVGVIWHVTRGPGHASRIVRELPGEALVVAVGGDGTVHEVAAGCVGRDLTFGVLPVGSGNDYVKALGVSTDLGRALEVLVAGKVRVVDAGEVNGAPFNNGLGVGFDAEVAAGVAEAPAYLGGMGRYLWSVGRLLWGFHCHEAALRLDGGGVIEAETILVAVALGTTYGSMFRLAPEARLDDGLFDVVWSEEISRAEVLRLIPAALGSTLPRHAKVHLARAREVEVELAEEVPAHIDGEILAPTRAFRARVLPGALRVVAP